MKNNQQKFVHYVMLTFTFGIGLTATYALLFGLFTVITELFN